MLHFIRRVDVLMNMSQDEYRLFYAVNKFLVQGATTLSKTSIFLTLLTSTYPRPDDIGLSLVRENYDTVAGGLDQVFMHLGDKSQFTEAERIISTTFKKYQTIIQDLHLLWRGVIMASTEKEEIFQRAIFLKHYEFEYQNAAFHLFKAASEHIRDEIKANVSSLMKCNGKSVRFLLAAVTRTLSNGMVIENAFYIYKAMQERANKENDMWKRRLRILSNQFETYLSSCREKFKEFSRDTFEELYQQGHNKTHAVLAQTLFQTLSHNFGQRGWFVFVYDEVEDINDHYFQLTDPFLYRDTFFRWKLNQKMVTVFSLDVDIHLKFREVEHVTSAMSIISKKIHDCDISMKIDTNTYPTKGLVKFLLEIEPGRAQGYYSVSSGLNLHFIGSPERFIETEISVPLNCTHFSRFNMRVVAFG